MKRPTSPCRHFLQYLACLVVITLLCACLLNAALTHAAGSPPDNAPAWATPNAMALRRVGPVDSERHEPNFLSNLDCQQLTYRLSAGSTMQTGCFTETAFGLIDSDSDTVLFNGTDEGLPLLPYSAHEILVPWPKAGVLLALDAANTGGSYISLYRNPLSSLQDQRNGLLQLTAKQLVAAPELPIKDPAGKQLVINPQTVAFSDDGSWLAAETLSGSFVRINLATLDMTAFAPAFGSQGSPALLKSQVALSENGRYAAIYNEAAGTFKLYDLANCTGAAVNLQPQTCAARDYFPFVRQQIAGLQSIRHVRFVNERLLSFEVPGAGPLGGLYELAPTDRISALIDYLGLGDSYTSGEGAFDYLAGTDTADDACHLSAHSYPMLLTRDLFSNEGGHSVACSGAVINDVGSGSPGYKGQVKGVAAFQQLQEAFLGEVMASYLPGYVAQQRFVQYYQPALTTVSVGGNDIGFGDILERCVVPHLSLHFNGNTCYNSYEDRLEVTKLIDRTVPRWIALYKELLAKAPGTRIYAIGYPQLADADGDCALNVHLSRNELEFSGELIDYLNNDIRLAADSAGVTYVNISQALAGHRLCETASYNVAVNGLTAGTDGSVLGIRVLGKESYHPNALGQALIEQAILNQTHNLTDPLSSPSGDANPQDILDSPRTGRTVNTIVPDDRLSPGIVQPGKALTLAVNGSRDGLKPGTVYAVRLDGSGGLLLGTSLSDQNGNISTNITLPAGTAAGEHTLDITGNNEADEPIDITQPIYIPVTDSDGDGDGIPDGLDTCPQAANSRRDSDGDGIDDTCDGFIGAPASADQGGSQNTTGGTAAGGASGGSGSSSGKSADTGSNGTGGVAPGEQPTPVANSLKISGEPAANSPSVGQGKEIAGTLGRGLGTTIVDPNSTRAATPIASAGRLSADPYPVRRNLYVINWPLYAGLGIIAWLFLLLTYLGTRQLLAIRNRLRQSAGPIG